MQVPLVLHGASGVPKESVEKAIALGPTKVNIATDLKIAFAQGLKQYLSDNPGATDPRLYMQPGKEQIKRVVAAAIKMCGSAGGAHGLRKLAK